MLCLLYGLGMRTPCGLSGAEYPPVGVVMWGLHLGNAKLLASLIYSFGWTT